MNTSVQDPVKEGEKPVNAEKQEKTKTSRNKKKNDKQEVFEQKRS